MIQEAAYTTSNTTTSNTASSNSASNNSTSSPSANGIDTPTTTAVVDAMSGVLAVTQGEQQPSSSAGAGTKENMMDHAAIKTEMMSQQTIETETVDYPGIGTETVAHNDNGDVHIVSIPFMKHHTLKYSRIDMTLGKIGFILLGLNPGFHRF